MNLVNNINPLDGDSYLVNGNNSVTSSGTDFDKIYNDISVDDSLENIFGQAAAKFGINENFLKAVAKAESGFDTNAESYCGAQGIMQLMPFTSESYGVTDPFDARQNIYAGAQLLSELLDQYNGNATLALAAYNAGSGSVSRYGGVPPYDETVGYINRINDYLGGALSEDSRTVDNAEATDFSLSGRVDVTDGNSQPDSKASVKVSDSQYVADVSSDNTNDSNILSYEDYMYVINTYKDILEKIFSVISTDEDDNSSVQLYNMVTGSTLGSVKNNVKDNGILDGKVYGNDPQSLYQVQASVVSPLILKLRDM
mgnify:CR=1 FL=1